MTSATSDDLWVRSFHPAPRTPSRLVCFPHAGGSASFYHPVSAALSPSVDVLVLQYPGRQERRTEPMIDDISELARQACDVLRGRLDERPTAFFGHSMGAVVAFEVARMLEAGPGPSPVRLYASGRRAPATRRAERVHLGDDEQVLAELRGLSGTDSRVLGDDELLRMVLPAIRNDYRAIESYRGDAGAQVRCPVTVLVGDDDPKTSLDEARAWEGHTTGGFTMEVFTGGHFYLAGHQPAILNRIRADLGA